MVRISQLPNIDPTVVSTLMCNKVNTVGDLWEKIGSDFKDGIQRVAKTTELQEAQLREILKQEAVARQRKSSKWRHRFLFFVSCYWREVLALVIGTILLSLLILNAVQLRDTLVVGSTNGLPAFHVIEDRNVHSQKMFRVHDSFTSKDQVIGRYLLQSVSPGAVLLKSQLGPPELKEQLKGREVLTIPVKSGAISSTIRPGGPVRLLFSPRPHDDSKTSATPPLPPTITDLMVDDVIVLAINRQGDSSSITVALKNEEDLKRALMLLTRSDVLISEG
jgi:hypothetical protein